MYKRYILNEWNDNPNEEQVDKDLHRKKFERQANYHKLNETLLSRLTETTSTTSVEYATTRADKSETQTISPAGR